MPAQRFTLLEGEAIVVDGARAMAANPGLVIGSVLVKRSAARTPDRLAFFGALTEAVPDAAAREQLRAALARLT